MQLQMRIKNVEREGENHKYTAREYELEPRFMCCVFHAAPGSFLIDEPVIISIQSANGPVEAMHPSWSEHMRGQ